MMCLVFHSAKYKTERTRKFSYDWWSLYCIGTVYEQSVLLPFYSRKENITFKLNKRVGTIVTQAPTFKNASDVIIEMKEKDFYEIV
jgi:hypothetical protein